MADERSPFRPETSRAKAVAARHRAAELVANSRQILWSCEHGYREAARLTDEAAKLRQARAARGS